MNGEGTKLGRMGVAGFAAIAALTVFALSVLSHADTQEVVHSAGQSYRLPSSVEINQTLLPDGRTLEVHGTDGMAYIIDGARRVPVPLPEKRRLASVTVLPNGQVFFWGGIDEHGRVLDTGEWFDPAHASFLRAHVEGLPARAAQSLTVTASGDVLMTGGWSEDGTPARTAVLWHPQTGAVATLDNVDVSPRFEAKTQLQPDGSLRIDQGWNAQGETVSTTEWFDPARRATTSHAMVQMPAASVVASIPVENASAAPLQGPLVLRFNEGVRVRELNAQTVTLLGPEGTVPIRVVGTNEGHQAFVQLPTDLYPGSRYTLFVKGLHTAQGRLVPYKAIGFTTTQIMPASVAMAGQGAYPASPSGAAQEPPLHIMTGSGHASCNDRQGDAPCRSRSFVRDGAFYPGKNNAADATGSHWRLYAKHQALPDTRSLEANLPKGVTSLIGQIRQIDETPVANVEVSVGDIKVHTDAHGVFVVSGLSAGRQELFVDGGAASHGEVKYGRFLVGADVRAHAISHMPFVMYMPRILPRDEVALPAPSTRELIVTHPDMPGLELHIPAGAVFKDRNGKVLTHIAIVPTPVDHAPFPLPDNFPVYFTIQPGDAVVQGLTPQAAAGIRVVYPNYGHTQANTASNFWVYDPHAGWRIYGQGHITPDAKQIAPDPGVAFTWMTGASAALTSNNPPNDSAACNAEKAEPVDLQTGLFFHEWSDLVIRDILPLTLSRAYDSADTTSHMFGIGGNSALTMHLYSNNGFVTPQLVLPCGQGIAFNQVSGPPVAANGVTGVVWEHTGTDSSFYGATLQFMSFSVSPVEYWDLALKDGTHYGFQNEQANQLVWIKDRYGNEVQLTYNGGLVDQVSSPSGRFITLNYDSSNRVSSAVDNTGRTVSYAYNSAGELATVTFPDQTTEQYTYDSNKRMLTMQDRRGTVWVSNQYDANGRVTKQTFADNTAYQFAYATDSNNNVTATTVTDPNGNQEQIAFDSVSHYPLTDTYAYGTQLAQTTTYAREASGLIDSMTDALGRKTSYTYDGLGNVTSVTRLAGTSNAVTTQFTYTSAYNQIASITDPLGHVARFSYTNGCLAQATDPLGHVTSIQCNGAGEPVSVRDPLGNTATFAYQGYDLQSVTDPLGRSVSYAVDALGRPIASRDPLGNTTLVQYDVNNRPTSVVNALNQATAINYDGNGNLLKVTLPNTGVIQYAYDARNRLITRTDAMGQSESWTYDGLNHVLTHTDRKGQVTDISYDALNRRSLVSFADGSGIQASYDAGNRLTNLIDSSSGALSWSYDGLDDVTGTSSPQGNVGYTYDAAGRRLSMTPSAQASASYTYDNANQLTSITQGSETVQLAYDADSRRTTLTLPNGITVNYGYDAASELTGLTYAQGNGTALGNLAYSYDSDGRVNSKSGSFATDVLPSVTAQPATFDLNGRKTSFNGQAMTYDANGNLTFDGTNTYTWNARNQLTQVSQNGNVQLSYGYDAMGRRIARTKQGTQTQFLYDGPNTVQEMQGNSVNPILVGLRVDERFARNDATGRTYFLTDMLNSTIALTDTTGAIRQQYSYDPYGNVTASDTTTGFTNPYQYTGREADGPGLYYYRNRYYSPMMSAFISEDRVGFGGGQSSFYAYTGANPVSRFDPSGSEGLAGDIAKGTAEAGGWSAVQDTGGFLDGTKEPGNIARDVVNDAVGGFGTALSDAALDDVPLAAVAAATAGAFWSLGTEMAKEEQEDGRLNDRNMFAAFAGGFVGDLTHSGALGSAVTLAIQAPPGVLKPFYHGCNPLGRVLFGGDPLYYEKLQSGGASSELN